MKQRSSLPMIVAVAVVAMVLGSFGTAVGAPALTKAKVKQIAAKVVTKKAPTLSVAHAATADSATTSTTATTATTAGSAGNADNLGGFGPGVYKDRINYAGGDSTSLAADTTGGTELAGPISLTVPSGVGLVRVTGTSSFTSNNTDTGSMWVMVDAVCASSGAAYDRRTFFRPASDTFAMQQFATSVSAGSHTFRLCGRIGAAAGSARGASILAETVAGGSTGGGSLRQAPVKGTTKDAQ